MTNPVISSVKEWSYIHVEANSVVFNRQQKEQKGDEMGNFWWNLPSFNSLNHSPSWGFFKKTWRTWIYGIIFFAKFREWLGPNYWGKMKDLGSD